METTIDAGPLLRSVNALGARLKALEAQVSEARHDLADVAEEVAKLVGIDTESNDG